MDPIVKLAADALPGKKKYVLFAGAGLSKDAGFPTTWDLMLETAGKFWVQDHPDQPYPNDLGAWFEASDYAKRSYAELIDEIYPMPTQQQEFLSGFLGGKPFGPAHNLVAELAVRGIIRAVITPNFDPCIEEAIKSKGMQVAVISTDEQLTSSAPLIQASEFRVYKYYGTLGVGALKNTPKDTELLPSGLEEELSHIVSQHGLLVLGFAGADPGTQKLFKKRNPTFYPIYWADPNPPHPNILSILQSHQYEHVPIIGASNFLENLLNTQERLSSISVSSGSGPSIAELERALDRQSPNVGELYRRFGEMLYSQLESQPAKKEQFEHIDEAVVDQIEKLLPTSYDFGQAASLAAQYGSEPAITALTDFIERAVELYYVKPKFSGVFSELEFDGYRFVVPEMLIMLTSFLLRNDRWNDLRELTSRPWYITRHGEGIYKGLAYLHPYLRSIEQVRNQRLALNRASVQADLYQNRFEHTRLSTLITFEQFMEADYFLYLRTVCYEKDFQRPFETWRPYTCIFLNKVPSYLGRAQRSKGLENLSNACGFDDSSVFLQAFKRGLNTFGRFFPYSFTDDIVSESFIDKLGTVK